MAMYYSSERILNEMVVVYLQGEPVRHPETLPHPPVLRN
jgi:hypothetical protein